MRTPIHSNDEIIKTGEMLATQRGGEVSAWDMSDVSTRRTGFGV